MPEEVHSLLRDYNIKMTDVIIETRVHSANPASSQEPAKGHNLNSNHDRKIGERSMFDLEATLTGLIHRAWSLRTSQ